MKSRTDRLASTCGRRRIILRCSLIFGVALLVAVVSGPAAAKHASPGTTTGGTLKVAEAQYPTSFDPALGANYLSDYLDPAYQPLIVKEPNGTFAPGLATSWKYGRDNKSFSITLRPGVRFSDGTTMTAAGVKAWIMHEKTDPGGAGDGYFASLTSITVSGKLHLTLRFSTPTPNLEFDFSQVLEMGEIGSPKTIGTKKLDTTTDGAGEYELDPAKTVTGETYTYVRNPYYWDKSAVHWKSIVIRVITNPSAALSALETGEVDVAGVQPITNAAAAKKAHLKVRAPLTLYMGLALENRGSGPLSNKLVREALNYAVNRTAIARVLGVGYGLPTDQMAVPGDDDYNPALKDYYTYDPAKAKQLLAQAGYPNGFSLSVLTLTAAQQNTTEELLQGELAAIGVTLQPTTETSVSQYETELATTTYPSITVSCGRLPASTMYQLIFGPDGQDSKPFGSTSAQLNSIYSKLISASPVKEPADAREMEKFIVQQAWYLPVAATPLAEFYRPSITGVNATSERPTDYIVEMAPAK